MHMSSIIAHQMSRFITNINKVYAVSLCSMFYNCIANYEFHMMTYEFCIYFVLIIHVFHYICILITVYMYFIVF